MYQALTPLIIVVGATASGKTALAIKLAQQLSGEVISADSRQVYRRLDIGTAKTTKAEMAGVPHHLIDSVDIDTTYTAQNFVDEATKAIETIVPAQKIPIIAGGTFFYIDALLGTIPLAAIPPDQALRATLEPLATSVLIEKLTALNPVRAANIDTNNRRRLIRAIEVAINNKGGSNSSIPTRPRFQPYFIGLAVDKEELRTRYHTRGEVWLQAGLVAEVVELLDSGVSRARLQEIGFEYTLTLELIDKTITKEDFLQRFVEKNWQYAKRQLTWLKRNPTINWYDRNQTDRIITEAQNWLKHQVN